MERITLAHQMEGEDYPDSTSGGRITPTRQMEEEDYPDSTSGGRGLPRLVKWRERITLTRQVEGGLTMTHQVKGRLIMIHQVDVD